MTRYIVTATQNEDVGYTETTEYFKTYYYAMRAVKFALKRGFSVTIAKKEVE